MSEWPFGKLKREHYGAILADPPWRFEAWGVRGKDRSAEKHYETQSMGYLMGLPVYDLSAENCVLFLWVCWPQLQDAMRLISSWGFIYKTCAFSWMKANIRQPDIFRDDADAHMGLGYWTRANSEACLLATKGKPKRLAASVRQGIIEPRREHSRKPDCVHSRINLLVNGPYCELFGRQQRAGWDVWGNQTDKFK